MDKQGQAGTRRTKQAQGEVKWEQGQMGQNRAKWGQTGPNEANFFACRHFLMRGKYYVLQPRHSDKNRPSYGDIVYFWILIELF